jgi:hypothetical protein
LDFIEKGTLLLLLPPVYLFHKGAPVFGLIPDFMFNGIQLPSHVKGQFDLFADPHPGGYDENRSAKIG